MIGAAWSLLWWLLILLTGKVFELTVERCEELFKQVFRKFDYEEACHGALWLEVSPADAEVAAWHLAAPPDERLAAFPVE